MSKKDRNALTKKIKEMNEKREEREFERKKYLENHPELNGEQ